MGTEEPMDQMKNLSWKSVVDSIRTGTPIPEVQPAQRVQRVVKRDGKKVLRQFRPIPDKYFMPRYSWPVTISFYTVCIASGMGAGMLLEAWIKKMSKDEDLVVWEFGK